MLVRILYGDLEEEEVHMHFPPVFTKLRSIANSKIFLWFKTGYSQLGFQNNILL